MTFIAKAPKIDVRRLRKKKSYEAEEVLRRLNDFLDKNFEEPMKILRHFWQDQQDAMTYAELREAIKAGHLTDETARAWRHDYARLVNDHLSHTWRNALALGPSGQPSMDNLTSFRLDMQKPGVLNWIGSRAADFVTNEVQEQKDAIRSVLMRGVTNQHTVDEMARVIRPLVGLNKPQTIANYNYYNHMVKTLTEQHPRTSAASIQARAQEAAVKYAEKQHRARAMMIARTELSFAYNRGAYEGIKQAQDLGLMGAVVKIWSTSQGGNVCPECEALEGEEVGMDAPFFDSRGLFKGDNLVPPLHPRCYCAIVYQEVDREKIHTEPEFAFDYNEYAIDESDPISGKMGEVTGYRVSSSDYDKLYLSEKAKGSKRSVQEIDRLINKAVKRLGIENEKNLPTVVITSSVEMKPGALASYVPFQNIMYIDESLSSSGRWKEIQREYEGKGKKISTPIHEYIHWMDAEKYRNRFGQIDQEYIHYINRESKEQLELLIKNGYNINRFSVYAKKSFARGDYAEAYTEVRVAHMLSR